MIIIDENLLTDETLKRMYEEIYEGETIIDLIKYKLKQDSKNYEIMNYLDELDVDEAKDMLDIACGNYNYKKE